MKKYTQLLLITTLLTACGGEGKTEAQRKAEQGITPDGTAEEFITIKGDQSGPRTFVDDFLEQSATKGLIATVNAKLSAATNTFSTLKSKGDSVQDTEIAAFKTNMLAALTEFFKLQDAFYTTAGNHYKQLDIKGDFNATQDHSKPWADLVRTWRTVSLFKAPEKVLEKRLKLNESMKELFDKEGLSDSVSKRIDTAVKDFEGKRKVLEETSKMQEYETLTTTSPSKEENLGTLETALNSAVNNKIESIFWGQKDAEGHYSRTLTANAAGLLNTLTAKMKDAGFIRLNYTDNNAEAIPFKAEDISPNVSDENTILFKAISTLRNIATAALVSDIYENLLSTQDSLAFGVTTQTLSQLKSGVTIPEDKIWIFEASISSGFYPAIYNNKTLSYSYQQENKIRFTDQELENLKLTMYKTFVSVLIPRPEFAGLFDFLKTDSRFKDDTDFMKLFQAAAVTLSAGTPADLSSGSSVHKAPLQGGSLDLRGLSLNGTSGMAVNLDSPLYVQLKGSLDNSKSTETLTGTMAYRLGNTVVGATQAYANTGSGFGSDARQLESSIVASHSLGSVFIEGQLGAVSADNVYFSDWSGMRSQVTLGMDTTFVSPFFQVTYRQLHRDAKHTLNETTAYVGLDMDIAGLKADTYSIDTRLLTKVGYGTKHWNLGSNDLGSVSGLQAAVEWSASLNLNSGVAFSTNLTLDSSTGSAAGFTLSLDR